jgi:hypothetical protein
MEDGVSGVPMQKGGETMDLAVDGLSRLHHYPSLTFFLLEESSQW